jgi:hypothetical protein
MNRESAVGEVRQHVEPKDCFVTTDNGKDWRPITGTGCAHFVAHILGVKKGGAGGTACMEGYTVPVRLLLEGLVKVGTLVDVKVADIWFNDATFRSQAGRDHCGIVTAVTAITDGQGDYAISVTPTIEITACSSADAGCGVENGVIKKDWATYYYGLGQFFRLPSATGIEALKDIKYTRL